METSKYKFRKGLFGAVRRGNGETDRLIELHTNHELAQLDGEDALKKAKSPMTDSRSDFDKESLAFLTALRYDDVEEVERLIRFAKFSFGEDRSPSLVIAAVYCGMELIGKLLDNGADPNTCDRIGRFPALVAARSGNSDCLDVLLDRGAMVDVGFRKPPETYGSSETAEGETRGRNLEEIWMVNEFKLPVPERTDRSPIHEAVMSGSLRCLELLLRRGVAVNRRDEEGDTPLHLAALPFRAEAYGVGNRSNEATNKCVEILLANGANLFAKNNSNLSAFEAVLKNCHKPIELLHKVFDDKIGPTKKVGDEDVVTVDFQPLCPCGEKEQINVLYELMENEEVHEETRRNIFKHPLLRAFVRRKWLSLRRLFYVYVSVYVVHVLSLSTFVTLAHCDVFYVFGLGWRLKTAQNGMPLSRGILVVTSTLVAINMLGLSYVLKHRYRWKPEMWRNLVVCVLSVFVSWYTVYDGNFRWVDGKGPEVQRSVTVDSLTEDPYTEPYPAMKQGSYNDSSLLESSPAANTPRWVIDLTTLAVFLAWLELMLLVGRFPKWASHAYLFVTVLKNVCRLLTTYVCMLLGFAFVFFLQFRTVDPVSFGDPWRAFVKTVIMMNGEFGFADMFREDNRQGWAPSGLPILSRVIFLGFVVTASIALMNLMVAIAVSDTRGLTKISSEIQFMKLTQSVVHWGYLLDSMWKNRCTRKIFRRFLEGCRSIPTTMEYSLKSNVFPRELAEDIKRISKKRSEGETSGTTLRGETRRFDQPVEVESQLREFAHSLDSMRREISAIRRLLESTNQEDGGGDFPAVSQNLLFGRDSSRRRRDEFVDQS